MLLQTSEKARAIFFFENSHLVGELLYPEFESMLDGFVPAKEWAQRTVLAAYTEINHNLAITSAVFFKIGFDDHGWVDGSWNLPLGDLARRAGTGPDLGAGPIALATAAQSPVELLTPMLWNPDAKGRNSHFAQLKKAIQRNRLGLCFVAEAKTHNGSAVAFNTDLLVAMEQRLSSVLAQQLSEQRAQDIRGALQQVMEEQARVPLLREVSAESSSQVQLREKALSEKDEALKHLAAQLESQQERVKLVQEQLEGQVKKTEGLREYYEHKLERAQQEQSEAAALTSTETKLDAEQLVREATQEFAELLQRKEVELLYRSEREEQLLAQLKRLQTDEPVSDTPPQRDLLAELVAGGISFVTFQPGSEPVVISPDDVATYIANPLAFIANSLGVSEAQYRAWLAHYQMPVCQYLDKKGNLCSHSLERVNQASLFVAQVSNFCVRHRQL